MKLTQGLKALGNRNPEKILSNKILLANTADRGLDKKALNKAHAISSDPMYMEDGMNLSFNPDIRYRNIYNYSPLTGINYRNDLLIFAENNEIKKVVNILANEVALNELNNHKYSVFPKINLTQIDEDKQDVAIAIQEYLDKVFYPKLMQYYGFKDEGLVELLEEFLITGKIAFEIIYDNLKRPKEIIGIQPIDPSTLQKFKQDGYIFYMQRPVTGSVTQRVLHENQVILIEWNKYDYGYISYVDTLRRSFNIMRSMQTSKILWFAAKSQVKVHVKLALGDIPRPEARQKLIESKNMYTNKFSMRDDGIVTFNNQPNNSGYREFFTGETSTSGSPEIEEVIGNGPNLEETDSLSFWQKGFYTDAQIPFDRIDPNSSDSWGFTDVNNLRKVEINFAKFVEKIRKMVNPIFMTPIIIQLTLQEAEIGVDLDMLDSIKMEWLAFNQYEKLAELEVLAKKVELAQNIIQLGELEDVNGNMRKILPVNWIMRNMLEFSEEELENIEVWRSKENVDLGYAANGTELIEEDEETDSGEDEDIEIVEEETEEDIAAADDAEYV